MSNALEVVGLARNVEELRHAEEQLGFARDRFLRDRGWHYSSSYPGSTWLWSKTIDGVEYRGVSTSAAISMESWADFLACECPEGEDGRTDGCPVHGGAA